MSGAGLAAATQRGSARERAARGLRAPRALSAQGLAALEAAVDAHLARSGSASYRASREGQRARQQLLHARCERSRRKVVPWLASALPLDGARILEVGCGTGSSSLALAEQGARLTSIDLDAGAIALARRRCELHELAPPEFVAGNAVELLPKLRRGAFDLILFYACLEHMTLDERLAALRASWQRLAPGQLLGVVETPNRLWPIDRHTSLLPFFHWLPDALAFAWSAQSPRASLRERCGEASPEAMREFLRRGRGVSFHEFSLALGCAGPLPVVSSLAECERRRQPWPRRLRARLRPDTDARCRALLRELAPGLHPGFCERNLDLILRAGD